MANIYRRGKTYWARAQRDGKEFRSSLKTKDRRVAERRFREWIGDLEAQAWGDRPRRAFRAAWERFIDEHGPNLKPESLRRYCVSIKWFAEKFGDMYLDQINRQQLSEFEIWRRSMGASAPTVRRDFACLSSILTSCEDWDWIEEGHNIVPGYLKRRARRGLRESPPRTRYLSHDEERLLLANATSPGREAVILAIDTGLRQKELFSLRWPQIDLVRRVIATTTETKNRRMRRVPFTERSAQILAQWKSEPTDNVASLFVITHEDGRPFHQMNKSLAGAARRAGIADLRWHDLRRTAGCRWLQDNGRSMEEVCSLMGHSSVQVTESRYAFLDNEKVAVETAQKSAHRPADYAKIANENGDLDNG